MTVLKKTFFFSFLGIYLLAQSLFGFTPYRTDTNIPTPGFITADVSDMAFGDVPVSSSTYLTLHLFNGAEDSLEIVYADMAAHRFVLGDYDQKAGPQGVLEFTVEFSPVTNIAYEDFLVIETDLCNQSIVIPVTGNGQLTNSDYDGTFNLFGEDLKTELSNLFPGQADLGYANGKDTMFAVIDAEEGHVLTCVYTGRSITLDPSMDPSESAYQEGAGLNCEHTWPQGTFDGNIPMVGDLYHLFPTDITANTKRAAYPLGIVNSDSTYSEGGSLLGLNKYGETVFEPRDVHKGDAARALFYFINRYQNYGGFMGEHQEADLRVWNEQDPVSQKELDRNDAIEKYQFNRNPFVDHAPFVNRISSFIGYAEVTDSSVLHLSPTSFEWTVDDALTRDTIYIELINTGNTVIQMADVSSSSEFMQVLGYPESLSANSHAPLSIEVIYGAGSADAEIQVSSDASVHPYLSSQLHFTNLLSVSDYEIKPDDYQLIKAFPNPFNAQTLLDIRLSETETSRLFFVDLSGRQVDYREFGPGNSSIQSVWQPAHDLSSGIYLLKLDQGLEQSMIKLLYLK